jgi:cell wall-associated NlpC family hydrolase
MLERQQFVDVARSWIGVKYQHQGRTRKGVDCIGLILGVSSELGVQLIAPDNYAPSPASNLVLKYADAQGVTIENKKLELGRIAVLWGIDSNEAQHFAVVGEYNGRQTMIHAFSRQGKVIEHSWDTFWLKRLMKVYELPGTVPLETA